MRYMILSTLSLVFLLSSMPLKAETEARIDRIVTAQNFQEGENIQVALFYFVPNACFVASAPSIYVDKKENLIKISVPLSEMEGVCVQEYRREMKKINVGPLDAGFYTIIANRGRSAFTLQINEFEGKSAPKVSDIVEDRTHNRRIGLGLRMELEYSCEYIDEIDVKLSRRVVTISPKMDIAYNAPCEIEKTEKLDHVPIPYNDDEFDFVVIKSGDENLLLLMRTPEGLQAIPGR